MTVALVTGCSSGIGKATAVELARQGWTVVATVRDVGRADALNAALAAAGVAADIRPLDVADDGAVAPLVDSLIAAYGGLDVVVSNAGIGVDGTTEELTLDDFRAPFETNVLGSVRLLHAVLPTWRQRGGGRFVAVGSTAGVIGNPFNDAYCASKFALEGLLESLQPVVAAFGIHVSIVEPGPVGQHFALRSAQPANRHLDGPYAAARARFQAVQDAGYAAAQTDEDVAAALWDVVTTDEPVLRYQTSNDVRKLLGIKLKDLSGERVTGLTTGWV